MEIFPRLYSPDKWPHVCMAMDFAAHKFFLLATFIALFILSLIFFSFSVSIKICNTLCHKCVLSRTKDRSTATIKMLDKLYLELQALFWTFCAFLLKYYAHIIIHTWSHMSALMNISIWKNTNFLPNHYIFFLSMC